MAEDSARALVVDDERQMASIVSFALETRGFQCLTAASAEQAWRVLDRERVDLVILDVMLPGATGIELCRRIRTRSDVPVLLLSARGDEEDRVEGLLAGADDYVTKPFSPRELVLRAEGLVRRGRARGGADELLTNGPLVVDVPRRAVTLADRQVRLGDVELRLLAALMRRAGQVVPWRDLLNEVWATAETVGGRDMLKTAVHRLRSSLGHAGEPLIVTVRGTGYLMPRLEEA